MSPVTLGDGAAAFQLRQNNVRLRTDLNTLTQEMSSGKKKDLTAALGDTSVLRDVDARLTVSQEQDRTAQEIGQRLGAMQTYLGAVDTERRAMFDRISNITPDSTDFQVSAAVSDAEDGFGAIVARLNGRFGGQYLFAGNATDTRPLTPPDDMLGALRTLVVGSGDADTAIARIEAWFDTPGGGFETLGYVSPDADPIERRIDPSTTVRIEANASDPVLRDLLKAAAIAAVANAPGIDLSDREQATMIREASNRLLSNAQPFNEFRAIIGQSEQRTEQASAQLTAQITTLTILRNTMDTADPFETATALQAIQTQLETHYTVTARLARLSLSEFLR